MKIPNNAYAVLAFVVAAMLGATVSTQVMSASRTGTVLASGQVNYGIGGSTPQQECDENGDVIFTFTETVIPEVIELERISLDSGNVAISVQIDEVCNPEQFGFGQASFEYEHTAVSGGGEIGEDLAIDPVAPQLMIPMDDGASQSTQVSYQALELDSPGSDDKIFALDATRILFTTEQLSEEIIRGERLVSITVIEEGGPSLPPDEIPTTDDRILDAATALNEACEAVEDGTPFAEACGIIAEETLTEEQIRQVARAFDPHEMAAMPAASSEGGRIQGANVNTRIEELRAGATGLSINGIALAFNGQRIDSSWLPGSVTDALSADSGGGSSLLSEQIGVFVNGEISLGDRDRRGKEVGFDFDSWGLTAGIDYRFDEGTFAGISLGYSEYDADLDQDGGSTEANTITVQGYGSYSFSDDIYLDATLGYSVSDIDQGRVVDLSGIGDMTRTIARSSTDADQYSASLALNYRLPLDIDWSVTPYGEFLYAHNEIDGFSEHGSPFALEFDDQKFSSKTLGLGFRVTRAINFASGVLSPFVDAAYQYESGNDGYLMEPGVAGTSVFGPDVEINDPDRHYGRLDAGASWVFLDGQQIFVNYSAVVFERHTTRHSIHFGFRGEF